MHYFSLRHGILYTSLISILSTSPISGQFSFKNVSAWFGGKPYEQEMTKEFIIDDACTLTVENQVGNIHIKKAWQANKIILQAHKKASTQADLSAISIIDKKTNTDLTIKTVITKKSGVEKAAVDYVLIVPTTVSLKLLTQDGSIKVNATTRPLTIATGTGDILLIMQLTK
jgi:hypothetical protein